MRASGIDGQAQPDGSFFEVGNSICRYINNYKTAIGAQNQHTDTLQIEAEQSILNLQKQQKTSYFL